MLGRGSWSPRSTPPPPQQLKVPKSGAVPGFAPVIPSQKVVVTTSSPTATVAEISLALNTVAASPSIAIVDEPAPVSSNALVPSPTASLAKDRSIASPPQGPLPMIAVGKVSSQPETAHFEPLSSSGAEEYLTKNTGTSPTPLTSANGASSTQSKTIILVKPNADANAVPAQNVSSAPPPPALAANAPPVQCKPPVLPPITPTNTTPVLPSPAKRSSATSRLEVAPAVPPAASTAKTYPVQKPTLASQSVKTALKASTSSVLPPVISVAKDLPTPDASSALTKAENGPGSLSDCVRAPQEPRLNPKTSVCNRASQKTQAEPTLGANLAESFKRLKIELESTVAEVVGKKGMKIAVLMVEIKDAEKLQSSTKELLNIKQKTVASMEFVIKGLRELRYGPQKLREKEHQISALKCEIEGLQRRLQSTGEQIKFKEQEIPTLNVEIECLKKSYFNTTELEKAKDQNFARLKVEINNVKRSQKAAEKLLDVKERQIMDLQAQVESCTRSFQTAEKMIDLKGKEMLGLRAALAFKAETDEVKNARANRELNLLDKALKQIKALELEIERLTKSQQTRNVVVGNDIALEVKTADLQRCEKGKTGHPGNSKAELVTKSSEVQAVSKTPKQGDPRKNDLMGPLIYFTNDELGIPTYKMDFEGVRYMPNEQKGVENDSPKPAVTATGTGIQIHITKTISWRAVILLLLAFLFSFSRILMLYSKP